MPLTSIIGWLFIAAGVLISLAVIAKWGDERFAEGRAEREYERRRRSRHLNRPRPF